MKKRIHRRALSALALSAALTLQSCGVIIIGDSTTEETTALPDTDASVQTTARPEAETSSYQIADKTSEYQALSDAYLQRIASGAYDYEGASFFVATTTGSLIHGEETGDIFSAAVYARNKRLEKALNVRLAASVTDESAYYDLLNASVLADDYFADLLQIPAHEIGACAAGDVLMNLRSVPLLDLSQPYFSADSIKAATAGNRIFAAAGAASLDITTLSAVYFNRDLFTQHGISLPYESVYSGTWTWDAFLSTCAAVTDINSSAQNTVASFAAQYTAELLPTLIFASSGAKTVRSEIGESPTVILSEADSSIFNTITRLYSDTARHTDADSGVSVFYTGKALYLIDRLFLMSWMPDSTENWGILPLPKLTEEQSDYITLADSSALFFAIPKNTVDAAAASVMMSAINAASYGVLSEAYVNYAMNEYLRDNDSANMLSLIAAHPTYDFALAFEGTTLSLSDATTAGLRDLADGLSQNALFSRAAAADKQLSRRFPVS